jgi:hypothetical protein
MGHSDSFPARPVVSSFDLPALFMKNKSLLVAPALANAVLFKRWVVGTGFALLMATPVAFAADRTLARLQGLLDQTAAGGWLQVNTSWFSDAWGSSSARNG